MPNNLSYDGGEHINLENGNQNGYINMIFRVHWYDKNAGEMGVTAISSINQGDTSGITTLYGTLIGGPGPQGPQGQTGQNGPSFYVGQNAPSNPSYGTVWIQA